MVGFGSGSSGSGIREELPEGGEVPFRRTQVGGSLPGVSVVTTAQRSGRSRRTGANAMSLVFYLHISACRCVRQSAACVAVPAHAGTAGGFPPCLPYSARGTGSLLPPFPDPAGMLVSPHKGTSL